MNRIDVTGQSLVLAKPAGAITLAVARNEITIAIATRCDVVLAKIGSPVHLDGELMRSIVNIYSATWLSNKTLENAQRHSPHRHRDRRTIVTATLPSPAVVVVARKRLVTYCLVVADTAAVTGRSI